MRNRVRFDNGCIRLGLVSNAIQNPVELLDRPDGAVVTTKPAAALPMQGERMGQGWLKVRVDGQDYYVEASQARTDLKLSGKPKCENLGGTAGSAASRGLGEPGCEP